MGIFKSPGVHLQLPVCWLVTYREEERSREKNPSLQPAELLRQMLTPCGCCQLAVQERSPSLLHKDPACFPRQPQGTARLLSTDS